MPTKRKKTSLTKTSSKKLKRHDDICVKVEEKEDEIKDQESGGDMFSHLGMDTWRYIMLFLDYEDSADIKVVSHTMNELFKTEMYWKNLIKLRWPALELKETEMSSSSASASSASVSQATPSITQKQLFQQLYRRSSPCRFPNCRYFARAATRHYCSEHAMKVIGLAPPLSSSSLIQCALEQRGLPEGKEKVAIALVCEASLLTQTSPLQSRLDYIRKLHRFFTNNFLTGEQCGRIMKTSARALHSHLSVSEDNMFSRLAGLLLPYTRKLNAHVPGMKGCLQLHYETHLNGVHTSSFLAHELKRLGQSDQLEDPTLSKVSTKTRLNQVYDYIDSMYAVCDDRVLLHYGGSYSSEVKLVEYFWRPGTSGYHFNSVWY